LAESLKGLPDYQLMEGLSRELESLDMEESYRNEQDVIRCRENEKLRERVLMLLGRDKGNVNGNVDGNEDGNGRKMRSVEELRQTKEEKIRLLTETLERMAVPAVPSPVKARNYAMAQKPMGVKVAWVCNWKRAIHSSPCGCGKPHLGGSG
jgi:hypothetical protein